MPRPSALLPIPFTLLLLGGAVFSARGDGAPLVAEWASSGELSVPRAYATVVPLATGEFLIVGGLDRDTPNVVNETSELFDPVTEKSRLLADRLPGRVNMSATTGWGERVVIAGGSEWRGDHWSVLDRVDVFNPFTRTWQVARPMARARTGHGAAALPDGRILVAGGYDGPRLISSAEIYDPRTDRWTSAMSLPQVRGDFSLVTLPDGRVLLAGGLEGKNSLPAKLSLYYDPARDRWDEGPATLADRVLHATVQLPDGDVLLIGGQRSASGMTERYDRRTGTFVYSGSLAEPRMLPSAATLPDGRVIVTGGLPVIPGPRDFTPTPRSELWDPATSTWTEIAPASLARFQGRLIAGEGAIWHLTGAGTDEQALASVERLYWR
ncbi:MAG: hypothetical protein HY071_03715 [Chloroflexi bacterium]|nr:hypothetical protein [Chloroflexota bacterium]